VDPRAAALARLFHNVQEGVYIGALGPDGSQTSAVNAHLKAILGYPADTRDADVLPFDAGRFVDPQGRTALLDRLTSGGAVTNYLIRLRRVDQSPIWVEVTGRAEVDDAGIVHLDALIRDVSERKKLDDETRGIYHQLLQAEKMAALGQTISGVAHELNNPLATILSWAERLSQKGKLEPSAQRGLEIILGEAERAARIVRQLLTFARKRQTTRAMIDVNQTVRETLALRAYEQHVSNITTIDALSAGLPLVFADGYQLQQVLLNLIINAEQAMLSSHGRGVLVVRTWHDQDHDAVVLEINDDGPGVPEELQPKVFDPFFTTKEVGKGTGLGLTVAYAIVQEHGGRIRLESRPGGGASFFIELPVTGNASPAHAPVRRTADTEAAPGSASILLVEDEAPLAVAVADALRDNGYAVEHAADGEQALQKVRHKTFDLIICDLKMPRVDGRAFYGMLQTAAPLMTRRVMFMTGDVAGTDAESFLESTGCRWLAKPFRLADLLKAVKESLSSEF
jgi:two-component system NtrC family sensor kinase